MKLPIVHIQFGNGSIISLGLNSVLIRIDHYWLNESGIYSIQYVREEIIS